MQGKQLQIDGKKLERSKREQTTQSRKKVDERRKNARAAEHFFNWIRRQFIFININQVRSDIIQNNKRRHPTKQSFYFIFASFDCLQSFFFQPFFFHIILVVVAAANSCEYIGVDSWQFYYWMLLYVHQCNFFFNFIFFRCFVCISC